MRFSLVLTVSRAFDVVFVELKTDWFLLPNVYF